MCGGPCCSHTTSGKGLEGEGSREEKGYLRKAACVTACVFAVTKSCSSYDRWTNRDFRGERMVSTRRSASSDARCLIRTYTLREHLGFGWNLQIPS